MSKIFSPKGYKNFQRMAKSIATYLLNPVTIFFDQFKPFCRFVRRNKTVNNIFVGILLDLHNLVKTKCILSAWSWDSASLMLLLAVARQNTTYPTAKLVPRGKKGKHKQKQKNICGNHVCESVLYTFIIISNHSITFPIHFIVPIGFW